METTSDSKGKSKVTLFFEWLWESFQLHSLVIVAGAIVLTIVSGGPLGVLFASIAAPVFACLCLLGYMVSGKLPLAGKIPDFFSSITFEKIVFYFVIFLVLYFPFGLFF